MADGAVAGCARHACGTAAGTSAQSATAKEAERIANLVAEFGFMAGAIVVPMIMPASVGGLATVRSERGRGVTVFSLASPKSK